MSIFSGPEHAFADSDFDCRDTREGRGKREDYFWPLSLHGQLEQAKETKAAVFFTRGGIYGFWVPKSLLMQRGSTLCVWCKFRPKWVEVRKLD